MSKKVLNLIVTSILLITLTGCSNPPSAPATPAPTPVATTNQTTVYMIKLDDNGATTGSVQVGCGDSAIPVAATASYQFIPTDPVASINAAMLTLLNTTATQYQPQSLMNSLAGQTMTIQSVDQSGTQYTVHLNGSFSFGGTCDMPRVKAQVEETIKKAALPGNTFIIDWNGGGQTAWNKAFSLKD
ncbi:MAG: hypothetical protein WC101_01900 [Candidatus Gracilibacteria bacterium]